MTVPGELWYVPTRKGCAGEFDVEALCRHERAGVVLVHCPDCGRLLGAYNRRTRAD